MKSLVIALKPSFLRDLINPAGFFNAIIRLTDFLSDPSDFSSLKMG